MKNYLLMLTLLCVCAGFSQTNNAIQFKYDANGNQILREGFFLAANRTAKNMTALNYSQNNKNQEQNNINTDVKYYPNPVTTLLSVKWKNNKNLYATKIKIFNISGQQLNDTNLIFNEAAVDINFQEYPAGLYQLVLVCNDGSREKFKIIKNQN